MIMTKEQKISFFKALYAKEQEYNRLAELEGLKTPLELAEMMDNTGYVDDYNRLIKLGLEDSYLSFAQKTKAFKEWQTPDENPAAEVKPNLPEKPEDVKPYMKKHGIKYGVLSEMLGYKSNTSLNRLLRRRIKPEEWEAVQGALSQLIEGR